MNLRSRIVAIENQLELDANRTVTVAWVGPDDRAAHERVAEVRRRGQRVRLITFSILHFAKTEAEAGAVIDAERARGAVQPITVYGPPVEGTDSMVTLASWGGAPSWNDARPQLTAWREE